MLVYLTTSCSVCQPLFSTFFKVFSGADSRPSSVGQVLARAPQRRNIRYLITCPRVCQVLFLISFKSFFSPCLPARPLADSSVIIPDYLHFVKNFFQSFSSFFSPPIFPLYRVPALCAPPTYTGPPSSVLPAVAPPEPRAEVAARRPVF